MRQFRSRTRESSVRSLTTSATKMRRCSGIVTLESTVKIAHEQLKQLVTSIFRTAGCQEREAERIAHYLVEANLAGHDSHGVIRVPAYVSWLKDGRVRPNQHIKVVSEN